jgi:cytochrome c
MTKHSACILAITASFVSVQPVGASDDAAADAAASKAACKTCHAVDKKIVGPSFQEIAKKYKGDPKAGAMLIERVRAGGAGKWGQVPMPPSPPDKISDADLKAVVEWILRK